MRFTRPRPLKISAGAARRRLTTENEKIFHRFLNVADAPAIIYHYCSVAAMKAIVTTGNLWATDVLTMADGTEIRYGLELADRLVAEGHNGKPVYLFKAIDVEQSYEAFSKVCTHASCFSSSLDLSNQWQSYAEMGRGFALGFDRQILYEWCASRKSALFAVAYDSEKQEHILRAFLKVATEIAYKVTPQELPPYLAFVRNQLLSFIMWLKHPTYKPESEWRLLVMQKKGEGTYQPVPHPKKRCCFELPFCNSSMLREVILGPDNETEEDAVKEFLSSQGFARVAVRRATGVLL